MTKMMMKLQITQIPKKIRKKQIQKIIPKQIPSKDDILLYADSIAKKINADDFIAYYSASDWRDNNGLPINWKQKLINWANREKSTEKPPKEEKNYVYNPYL